MAKLEFKNSLQPWEKILSESVTTPDGLSAFSDIDNNDIRDVTSIYPMRINSYYLGLIKNGGDAIRKQVIPDIREIMSSDGWTDPLNEEGFSPVPGLTHKYPDRVLLLVSSLCAVYCRFCNRKRKVGNPSMATKETIREGIAYIRTQKKIRDVLLSGGDPLLLSDSSIFQILGELRSIPHVEIIRIGTRIPCTLPQRVTPELVGMLKGFHPLFINTHFNHPSEVTPQSSLACSLIADAGIPIGCQTVLLKGINDDAKTIKELMQKLLAIRVKPYYLFQPDLVKGTSHFWTPLKKGIEIMEYLQGNISGLAIPRFMIDLPHGGGKIPVTPEYICGREGDELIIKNYKGEYYRYPIRSE
ncbi:MAG: KamA family radical SAM protein [Deltaproteobacteria bacterium]|nr:KamA family radical SAM protein [Deltaproteobacteria bacterium]